MNWSTCFFFSASAVQSCWVRNRDCQILTIFLLLYFLYFLQPAILPVLLWKGSYYSLLWPLFFSVQDWIRNGGPVSFIFPRPTDSILIREPYPVYPGSAEKFPANPLHLHPVPKFFALQNRAEIGHRVNTSQHSLVGSRWGWVVDEWRCNSVGNYATICLNYLRNIYHRLSWEKWFEGESWTTKSLGK